MRREPNEYDFTMLSDFSCCPYKYYLRHIVGLVGHKPPIAANFGRVIHMCLDEWYKSFDVAKAIEILRANWKDTTDSEKHTIAIGEKMLKLYDEKYKDPPFKILSTETTFEMPIKELGIVLIGRIDKIIEWHGRIGVMDHKTTSGLGSAYFNSIKPNAQFTGYGLAGIHLGYKVEFVLLDALLVAKGLLVPAQLARLTPLGRDEANITEDDKSDWLDALQAEITEIHSCACSNKWAKRGMFNGACTDFGECPYRAICKEDKNIREAIKSSDYRVEFWDPREAT